MPFSVVAFTFVGMLVVFSLDAVLIRQSPDFQRGSNWWPLVAFVGIVVLNALLNLSFGITLTADQAIVRGFRRRRYAWTQIVAVTQETAMGSRRMRIWTVDGRSQRLRVPISPCFNIGRARFERDFHVIGQWWLAHRQVLS